MAALSIASSVDLVSRERREVRYLEFVQRSCCSAGTMQSCPYPHICANVILLRFFERVAMSRLTIDITEQQHQSLKALAALQGKTIKQYAIERLFPVDVSADHAWQALRALIGERIADGLAGKVSTKSLASIVEEELGKDTRP